MSCRVLIIMLWNSGVICTGIRIPSLKTHFHHICLLLGFDSQDDIDDSKEKQFTDKVNEKLQNIIAEMKASLR